MTSVFPVITSCGCARGHTILLRNSTVYWQQKYWMCRSPPHESTYMSLQLSFFNLCVVLPGWMHFCNCWLYTHISENLFPGSHGQLFSTVRVKVFWNSILDQILQDISRLWFLFHRLNFSISKVHDKQLSACIIEDGLGIWEESIGWEFAAEMIVPERGISFTKASFYQMQSTAYQFLGCSLTVDSASLTPNAQQFASSSALTKSFSSPRQVDSILLQFVRWTWERYHNILCIHFERQKELLVLKYHRFIFQFLMIQSNYNVLAIVDFLGGWCPNRKVGNYSF